MKDFGTLLVSIILLSLIVQSHALSLPAQSRYTLSDDARLEALFKQETEPLRAEINGLRHEVERISHPVSPPRFEEIPSSGEKRTDSGQHGPAVWNKLGIPPRLIKSLEDLVEAFNKDRPKEGSTKPFVPQSVAGSTSRDQVSKMITNALQQGPPIQPQLMERMFNNWFQQQNAMNYLQQTQPLWIQSALSPQMAGPIVPVDPNLVNSVPSYGKFFPYSPSIPFGETLMGNKNSSR